MVTLVKRTNQKNHVFFMPHVFNQSGHPPNQNEHFEKTLFLIVIDVNIIANITINNIAKITTNIIAIIIMNGVHP
jgi:hypothetical protein